MTMTMVMLEKVLVKMAQDQQAMQQIMQTMYAATGRTAPGQPPANAPAHTPPQRMEMHLFANLAPRVAGSHK